MDLFTYLMSKKGNNTQRDLFSYLLGKGSGGGGTYTTYTGTSLNISNSIKAQIKKFMLNSTELTQDGTPTPSNPIDVNVIKNSNAIKINQNLADIYKSNILSNYAIASTSFVSEEGDYIIYIPCKSNTQYEIYKIKSDRLRLATTIENPLTIPQLYQFYESIDTSHATFTTNDSAKYLCIFFRRFSDVLTMQEILNTLNVYETNEEQIYPITLGSENLFNPEYYLNRNFAKGTYMYTPSDVVGNRGLYFKAKVKEGKSPINGVYVALSDNGNNPNKGTQTIFAVRNGAIEQEDIYKDFTGINNLYISYYPTNYTWAQIDEVYEFSITTEKVNNLEYCKIGNYADQIFKNTTDSLYYDNTLIENEWYLKKKIGKIDSYNGETITTPYISTTGGLDTGATVYYGLETPTYIHISQEDYPTLKGQLDNLYNNAESYDEQTNITQTNDDLPFNINVDVKVKDV